VELAPFGHTYDDRLLTACGTDIKINTGLKINRPAGASAKKAHSLAHRIHDGGGLRVAE
jgi:hypothetical protein